jgi:flagellar biosynthesis GTPase FlhF
MPYAYETLLAKHNLSVSGLPKDAQDGIAQIQSTERGLNLLKKKAEKSGKPFKLSGEAQTKVSLWDKFVVREIMDFLDDKDSNPAKPKDDAAQILADEEKKKQEEAAAAAKIEADKAAADQAAIKAEEDRIAAEKQAADQAVTDKQNAITEKMNTHKHRAITYAELGSILGRTPADREQIGTLKLRRVRQTLDYISE